MDGTDSPDSSYCILLPQHFRELAILIIMDLGPTFKKFRSCTNPKWVYMSTQSSSDGSLDDIFVWL